MHIDVSELSDLVGTARVVALGESAHWIREYGEVRHRMLRILVEDLGFDLVAAESGFSEGLALNRWVSGGSVPGMPERGMTYRFGRSPETQRMLGWMRERGSVAYAGLDLPGELASILPALDNLDEYLAGVDPDAGEIGARIRRLAEKWAGPHTMPAFAAFHALPPEDRDELTVLLAELAARFDALRPLYVGRSSRDAFDDARHELRLAGMLDQALRAQMAGRLDVNVRDAAMAETARRLLARDGRRIVVLAANGHIQRVPMGVAGLEVPVLGAHLATELGDDYVAIALTAVGGRTLTRRRAPADPRGAEVIEVELDEPAADSVEAMTPAGRLTDLRPLRGTEAGPRRMRVLDLYTEVPVVLGFDLVATLPEISPLPPDQR